MTADAMILSHSQLKSFAMCRRRWWLAWHLGWTLRDELPTGVVHVGSHVHLALEGWYGYRLDPLQVLRWSYDDVIAQRPEHTQQLQKDYDLAEAMIDGFMSWAAAEGIDAGLEVIATEHEVSYPLELPDELGPVILRAKLDQLVRRESDGRLLFRDWKTVGGFEKAHALLLDQQMRFYALLQGLIHRDGRQRADGALYVMLKRSKRTARAAGPFYQQLEISYNRYDLNSTYLRALSIASDIVETTRDLTGEPRRRHAADPRFSCPPNPTDFCSWGCQFFQICHMFDDGSRVADALAAEYVQADPLRYYDTSRIQRAVAALDPR